MKGDNKVTVSVLVLTYNHEAFINDALASIETQDFDDIQVVIGDDASSDTTSKLIDTFENSSRLEFEKIYFEKNVGITKNFNACLAKCTGDFIFLLGGDDIFLPGKISMQVKYMLNNPRVDISYHNVEVFDSDTDKRLYLYNEIHGKYEGSAEILLKRGTFNCGCSVAVRNKSLPFCDERIKYASDWLWYIDILMKERGNIGYIDGVWSRYRRHCNNITGKSKFDQQYQEVMLSLEIASDKYPLLRRVAKLAIAERKFAFSLKNLMEGYYFESLKLFWEAISLDILSPVRFIKLRAKRVLYGNAIQ